MNSGFIKKAVKLSGSAIMLVSMLTLATKVASDEAEKRADIEDTTLRRLINLFKRKN